MPIPTRHSARILALQIVYSREKLGVNHTGESAVFDESLLKGKYKEFSSLLIETTWNNLTNVDQTIQKYLKNWKQTRLTDTLNALLRISVAEMLYFPDTESKIIINEAIEICREFVDEKATKMCNGVLHSVSKEIRLVSSDEKEG
ncbi:transcription antitermination factor NusB [bacterium]|nr:transcription antitermination factor NusB [bacterium]